ncbi:MAG: hypothetical protein MUF78_01650 [Candidatus Edwardsbacteria bacterium]|jgi:hypothetical protein|nr:hypothetical protein [Candidatus Edwardsbacteria bacterium]
MRSLALAISIAAIAVVPAAAQNSGVLYWNMPTTPAQLAFAASSAAMSDEPQGLAANPAALAAVSWRSLSTAGVQWWEGIYGGSVGATLPLAKRRGTVWAALGYWSSGSMAGYDDRGAPLGNISAQAVSGAAGYGYQLFGGFAAGLALKFSALTLPQRRDLGFAADCGAQYRWRSLAAALLVQDLGPKYPVNGADRATLPTAVSLGGRLSLWRERITVAAQYTARDGERPQPSAGLAVSPVPLITVRVGLDGQRDRPQMSPLGLGLAVRTTGKQDYTIEYGYRSHGDLGRVQALALGISF